MTIRRYLPYLFWAALVFAFVMAILPKPPQLPGDPSDKVQHILAFITLAALATIAYPRTRPIKLGLGLSAYGALIEVVQAIPILHRDAEFLDWAADTVAAFGMLLLVALVRRLRGDSV